MALYGPEPERTPGRRQAALGVVFVLAALGMTYLPPATQQRVAWSLRATVLRPFLATQERLVEARWRAQRVEELQAQLDSATGLLATQAALADENRTLRQLLELRERAGPAFRPATVIRPGTPGSESMFLVELGAADGVRPGAPVVTRHGLVGRILEVREGVSVGMDWTHPDFRASAMLADGRAFGIVENERGRFREEDRLVLNGTAYFQEVREGTLVLTSGLGGVLPRGIPIGEIMGVRDAQGRWRKSYWIRPRVAPAAVTHVLVGTELVEGDVGSLWSDFGTATEGGEPR